MATTASFIYRGPIRLSDLIMDCDFVLVDDFTGEPRKLIAREVVPPDV